MASKRLRKKSQNQQITQALGRKGYTSKQIKRLDKKTREREAKAQLRKEEKRKRALKLREEKASFIATFNLEKVTLTSRWTKKSLFKHTKVTPDWSWEELNRLKKKADKDRVESSRIKGLLDAGYRLDEIIQKMVSSEKAYRHYLDLKSISELDWNKVYHSEDGIYFSFRDISQNCDLRSIIASYLAMDIKALLEELKAIVERPCSYEKGISASSGRCGQAQIDIGDDEYLKKRHNYREMHDKTRFRDRINRLKKKRKYKGTPHQTYIPYQVIKQNGGYIHDTTLKNLIAIVTALLNNVFEETRLDLYKEFWYIIKDLEPKALEYIPPKPTTF